METLIKTIIADTQSTILRTFYEKSKTDEEKQIVIDCAQDLGCLELSDVLIDRFELEKEKGKENKN